MKPMTKLKQLNDLTLLDRFLFASVMEDEETLELALSIIMGEELHLRQPNQLENGCVRSVWTSTMWMRMTGFTTRRCRSETRGTWQSGAASTRP